MKAKTNLNAGGIKHQHNQTSAALKVRTNIKAGLPAVQKVRAAAARMDMNHNQTSAALKVQTHIKAGPTPKSRRIVDLQS